MSEREWRPIATAPKDGTRFLAIAWDSVIGVVSVVHRHDPGGEKRNPRHHYECWVTDFNSPAGAAPTHWMPLPPPPTGSAESAELADKTGIIANLNERSAQYERDAAAKDARIAELENKNSYNLQIVREATARIAELEAQAERIDAEYSRTCKSADDVLARAERAEAENRILRSRLSHSRHSYVDGIPSDQE